MFIYIALFILLLIGIKKRNSRGWLFICTFSMAIIIGTRTIEVGTDTKSYIALYKSIVANGYIAVVEPGYGFSEYFFSQLGFGFNLFQTAMTLIMFYLLYTTIRKSSVDYAFSLFIFYGMYFMMYTMNIYRQMFAVMVLLMGYFYLSQGRKKIFLILVVIAMLFHMSSVVAFGALFINKIKVGKRSKTMIMVILSLMIGFVMSPQVFASVAGGYAHYLLDSDDLVRTGTRLLQGIFLSIFWSILFVSCYLFTDARIRENFWFKMFYLATILNNVCLRLELGLRILLIFSICQVIALPLCVSYRKGISKASFTGIIILFLTVFFYTMLLTNSADVVPYKSVIF